MDIVGAFACSHAGLMISRRDRAPPELRAIVYDAFTAMGTAITAARPDAIVLIATDHGAVYPLAGVPQFTIGVSETARSAGDAELPVREVKLHQGFAQAILTGCIEEGVDLAFSEAMIIDHSFLAPLLLAFGDISVPIVPIAQNCNVPPLPTLRRSHEVGGKLRRAIERGPAGRVVIIGTGGLSHWVGSPEFQRFLLEPPGTRLARQPHNPLRLTDVGPVNVAFDRQFLDLMCQGKAAAFLRDWSTERLYAEAGNGAQELRNWLLTAGAVEDCSAEVLGYAAVSEWLTGTAVVRFNA